jgi:hypothetical protein
LRQIDLDDGAGRRVDGPASMLRALSVERSAAAPGKEAQQGFKVWNLFRSEEGYQKSL